MPEVPDLLEDEAAPDDESLARPGSPPPPATPLLNESDPKTLLQRRVQNALLALPGYFSFDNPIAGVNATDLFNLNTLMGAGIEVEVVRTLNGLRNVWDPDGEWLDYTFERSNQSFPDVRLVRRGRDASDIALGVELKGWFLFAKEGVPSLRFQVAPAACAPHDLVCVVPWHLSNAVAGVARVITPWVTSARYAAEYRDYWWKYVRVTKTKDKDTEIKYPPSAAPYPTKAELVIAVPNQDGGKNYGRLPRCRPLMTSFIEGAWEHEVLGISVLGWFKFLKLHSDTALPADIQKTLDAQLNRRMKGVSAETTDRVLAIIEEMNGLFRP